MTIYTIDETNREFANLLEKATTDGAVCIQNSSGVRFILKPEIRRSPLDIEGAQIGISRDEIVSIVRESRER